MFTVKSARSTPRARRPASIRRGRNLRLESLESRCMMAVVLVDGADASPDHLGCGDGVNPCDSISAGVAVARPNDHLHVKAGMYHESVNIDKPLVLINDGGIVHVAPAAPLPAFTVTDVDGTVGIQGVFVGGTGDGIYARNAGDLRLVDVISHDNETGVRAEGTGKLTIVGGSYTGNEFVGIGVFGEIDVDFTDPNVIHNGHSGLVLQGVSSVQLEGGNYSVNGGFGIEVSRVVDAFLLHDVVASRNAGGHGLAGSRIGGATSITTSHFNDNVGTGLSLKSVRSVTLDRVVASGNGLLGTEIQANGNVTIRRGVFRHNGDTGASVVASNNVELDGGHFSNNLRRGASLSGRGTSTVKGGARFEDNGTEGLMLSRFRSGQVGDAPRFFNSRLVHLHRNGTTGLRIDSVRTIRVKSFFAADNGRTGVSVKDSGFVSLTFGTLRKNARNGFLASHVGTFRAGNLLMADNKWGGNIYETRHVSYEGDYHASNSFVVTPASLTHTFGTTTQDVIRHKQVKRFQIRGSASGDTFHVTPSKVTAFEIAGDRPTTHPGDKLLINPLGLSSSRRQYMSGPGTGTLTTVVSVSGRKPITYREIEQAVVLGNSRLSLSTDGLLKIIGTDNDNHIHIGPSEAGGWIVTPLFGTQLNGSTAPIEVDVPTDVLVDLGDGGDSLTMDGTAAPLVVSGGLLVEMGDGDDLVDLAGVTVGETTSLATGGGNDRLRLVDDVFTDLGIDSGAGDDRATLDRVESKATAIHLRGGADELEIDDSRFSERASIRTGAGNDSVRIERTATALGLTRFDRLLISLGHGDDSLLIGGLEESRTAVFGGAAAFVGGGGHDTLDAGLTDGPFNLFEDSLLTSEFESSASEPEG